MKTPQQPGENHAAPKFNTSNYGPCWRAALRCIVVSLRCTTLATATGIGRACAFQAHTFGHCQAAAAKLTVFRETPRVTGWVLTKRVVDDLLGKHGFSFAEQRVWRTSRANLATLVAESPGGPSYRIGWQSMSPDVDERPGVKCVPSLPLATGPPLMGPHPETT